MSGQLADGRDRHPFGQEPGAEGVPELVRVHAEAEALFQALQHRVDGVLVQLPCSLADQEKGAVRESAVLPLRANVVFDEIYQI